MVVCGLWGGEVGCGWLTVPRVSCTQFLNKPHQLVYAQAAAASKGGGGGGGGGFFSKLFARATGNATLEAADLAPIMEEMRVMVRSSLVLLLV